MLNRIFGIEAPDCSYLGRRPLFMLKHLLHKYDSSLGIVAGSGRLLTRMRQDDDIEVSWWIDSELEIAAALDPEDRPKSLKEDLRRVRKNRLEFRCVTDFESYRYFYDNYYLPSVIDSHGAAALPTEFDARWKKILNGEAELIWITQSGVPICGIVVCYDGQIPILRDLGIKDGNKSIRKTGAIAAAYYFAMQHLASRGFDRVRLGPGEYVKSPGLWRFQRFRVRV